MHRLILLTTTLLLIMSTGCHDRVVIWSPDGTRAAHISEAGVILIDESGKVLQTFKEPGAGVAWSQDSKTLFFTTYRAAGAAAPAEERFEQRNTWLGDKAAAAPKADAAKDASAVSQLEGDKVTPLFSIADGKVARLELSPNGQWLGAITIGSKDGGDAGLYVFHRATRRLFPVSSRPGFAFTFTGPSRLAFVQVTEQGRVGDLVEVELDPEAASLKPEVLVPRVRGEGEAAKTSDRLVWSMVHVGNGDLLISRATQHLPGVDDESANWCDLVRWSRADGKQTVIAKVIGAYFSVSPDGKRLLLDRLTVAENRKSARREIVIGGVDGKDLTPVMDISIFGFEAFKLPIVSTWKGNDSFVFVAPPEKLGESPDGKVRMEAVFYRVTGEMKLERVKTISETWNEAMKPAYDPAAIQASRVQTLDG